MGTALPRGVAARRSRLLAGVSPVAIGALALAIMAGPVQSANYTAANEAELQARIAQANADGDPSSTITLTANITLTSPAASLGASTKPLNIDTAGFAFTSATPSGGTVTYGGSLTGGGNIALNGAGTTILTGSSTRAGGPFAIRFGTVELANGGQVNGTGTIAIEGDGSLLTITGAGTEWRAVGVTVGSVVTGGAATLDVQDGARLIVNGTLSVGNINAPPPGTTQTVNITGGGQVESATFNIGHLVAPTVSTILISGAGSGWTNSGNLNFARGSFSVLDGGTFTTAIGTMGLNGTALLTVAGAGSTFTSNGTFNLGSAIGTGSTSVLTLSDGGRFVANGALNIGTVANALGVLNIGGVEGGPATGAGILQAASVTLGADDLINFNHTDAAYVFSTAITGAGAVNLTGPGTTILTGANTYTGGTTIAAGTLAIGANDALGAATGPLTFNGGTLRFDAGFNLATTRAISITAAGGTIDTNGVTTTIAQGITGAGALQVTGAGTLILTGTNTYSGGTVLTQGTLAVAADGALGAATGPLTFNGGTLRFDAGFDLSATRAIGINAAGGTIEISGFTTTIAQGITGAGALTVAGPGILTLTGDSPYAGGTTINPGAVVQLGAGGTTGSIQGNVLNNGTLAFNRSDTLLLPGAISGAGTVLQTGTGTTILAGENTYSGGTAIFAGALQLGNGGTTGSIVGNVLNNGTLAFNRSDTLTYAGVISGIGGVRQAGTGTTILAGANTYSAGTVISQGTLAIAADSAIGDATSNLAFDGGTLRFDAGFDLAATRPVAITAAGGTIDTNGFTTTIAQGITGAGGLTVTGAGNLILTGANAYAGGTAINAGARVQLGAGGTSGGITGNVLNNGTLAFNRSDAVTFAGVISGTGAVVQEGAGTTILTSDNTYTGGTTISAGALQLGAGGTSGSIQGNLLNNGTLTFNRSDAVTFAGAISGSGAVRQDGTGTTILTGENTYTGGTTITQGTLQLGNGGTSGSIIGNVLNNSLHSLVFNRSNTLVFDGVISGIGAVRQEGTGTTILTGANTYSGPTSVNAGVLQAGATNTFSASSAVTVAAAGTLALAGFDQTIPGLTNAGLVTLGGAPGTRLTVAGNYAGQGGVLALNTVLGGDSSASDRLVIQGGTATGDTRMRITNIGGPGAQTVEGIRVVETQAGGTTAAGAFRLDTRVAAGAFEYQLFRGGNTSAQDWYLRSFTTPVTPVTPDTPVLPSDPVIPLYRPEVALYAPISAVGRQMGLATLGTLHSRLGGQDGVPEPADPEARSKLVLPMGNGAWARAFGERRRDRWDGPAEASAVGNLIGLQAGFDIFRSQPYGGGHGDVVGLYVAYADYNAPDVSGFAIGSQQRVGRLLMSGPSVGAYWTHVGPGGWYLDTVFQANWFDVTARSDFGAGLETNGTGYTASLEAGYPIRIAPGWQIEPQAQAIWQSVSVDRSRDLFSSVDWDEDDAVNGRIGARLQYTARTTAAVWQPYAKVNLWHAFSGTDRVSFGSSAPIASRFGDTALEVGGGITARVSDSTSFYAHADYRWSVDGGRGRHSATQGSIGIRFTW